MGYDYNMDIKGLSTFRDIRDQMPTGPGPLLPRKIKKLDGSVTHHAGNFSPDILAHARFHTNPKKRFTSGPYAGEWMGRGWRRFAYDTATDLEGLNYITGDYDVKGNHCEGHNYHTVGHLVLGNYEERVPTDKVITGAAEAQVWHRIQLDRPLSLLWHDDTKLPKPYVCPGKYWPKREFADLVEELYREVLQANLTEVAQDEDAESSPKFNPAVDYRIPFIITPAEEASLPPATMKEYFEARQAEWRKRFTL